jgi:hypothetical protein
VACPALWRKYFCFSEMQISLCSRRPDPQEGRCATSPARDRMRWTPIVL